MGLGFGYRVHVSRMMLIPFGAAGVRCVQDGNSAPKRVTHFAVSSSVTADAPVASIHWILYGANSSLLPPRHRCYEPLSAALSALARESRANSYLVRQDGLW